MQTEQRPTTEDDALEGHLMNCSTNDAVDRLNASDFETRIDAMSELRDRKDASAVPALVQLLQKERDHRIREEAVFSLESIGDARGVEPLIDALMAIVSSSRRTAGHGELSPSL
jgi:HEAT repeat protein